MPSNCNPSRRIRRPLPTLLLGTTIMLACPQIHAQGAVATEAERLDAEGTALLNQRRLEEACPKLAESFRKNPGTGVQLRLALCLELSGKIASAQAAYLDARERASAAGDERIERLAERRAAELAPRLSHLTIRLDDSLAPSVEVWRNGARVPPSELDRPVAIDPGTYVVEAAAPARVSFEQTIVVGDEPARHTVVVTLPPATPSNRAAPPPAIVPASTGAWSTQKSIALAAGGVGLAGVTLGTILGLGVGSKMDRARSSCTNGTSGCPENALQLQDEAHRAGLLSTLAFGVGAAGLAAGAALWFTDRTSAPRETNATLRIVPGLRVEPSSGLDGGGIHALGTW